MIYFLIKSVLIMDLSEPFVRSIIPRRRSSSVSALAMYVRPPAGAVGHSNET